LASSEKKGCFKKRYITKDTAIKLFESRQARTSWNDEEENGIYPSWMLLPYLLKVLTLMPIGTSLNND
jgi:hypothetical protein